MDDMTHIDYPYLCPTCKHNNKNWDELPCDGCCGNRCYEPKEEGEKNGDDMVREDGLRK